VQDPKLLPCPTPISLLCPKFHLKWEKKLPSKFIIAATEGKANSFKLKVELETTDTTEIKSANALVDCGATGEFIDHHYAKSSQFWLLKLPSLSPSSILMVPPMKMELWQKLSTSYSNIKTIQNILYLLSPISESRNSSLDTLGYINTIWKSTGKLEKSRCLGVLLIAVLAVERMPNKSKLFIKLKSVGRKLVPMALSLNSIMTRKMLRILTTRQNA
jgi:hypothetical protein